MDIRRSDLVAVSLTDRTVLVRPFIPYRALQIMDIVGLSLIDPKHLLGGRFDVGLAQRDCRKLL